MFLLLSIILILCSVAFWPYAVNDSFWVIKEAIFVAGSLAIFSYSFLCRSNFTNLKDKYLSAFLLYVTVGFIWFFYSSFVTANGKVSWNFWNFRPTINVLCAIVLMKILYEYAESMKEWVNIGKVIAWLGGLFAVYSIFQYFGIDQIFNKEGIKFLYTNGKQNGEEQMVTFFGSAFISSAFLATCSPMCLIFRGVQYKILYGFIFTALVLMNKTMALMAFGCGLYCYLIMNGDWKKIVYLSSVIFLGGIVYYFKNPNFYEFTGRPAIWIASWEAFLKAPFFGHGLGFFEMLSLKAQTLDLSNGGYKDIHITFAHNEFIQNLVDLGLVGSAIYLAFMTDVFKKIFYAEKNILLIGYTAGLISVVVLCFGSFPLRIAPIALVAIIYITSLLYQCKGEYR